LRVQIPAKAKFAPLLKPLPYVMPIPPNTLSTPTPSRTRTWQHFIDLLKRNKNPRFPAFLDSNLHTRLVIITKNELGLAFPPRNLPKKFHPDPSTFYLVIVVTNRHTNRQTDRQNNAGKNIIPRFRGDNNRLSLWTVTSHSQLSTHKFSICLICEIESRYKITVKAY